MAKIHVLHLGSGIKKLFQDKIDMSDVTDRDETKRESKFLSRGLAAYAIHMLANASVEDSAKSITDGGEDNGIDAIYFEKQGKTLWVVQSKWIVKGEGSIDNGDMKKFCDGIKDLLELKYENFNEKVKGKSDEIEEAIYDFTVKMKIVVAFTGSSLSSHNKRELDDICNELNDPSEYASYISFNLSNAYKSLSSTTEGQPINLDINLLNWGKIENPIQAFYGSISAQEIAEWWGTFRRRLLTENIRSFIGDTDVNLAIEDTAKTNPEHFWYFNNGITVLCDKIVKLPIGGEDRGIGVFHCENVKVVNGAQTVGTLGTLKEQNIDVSKASILIRLISLQQSDSVFGQRITKATNTQNRIEKRDFVTQDPQQERLRLEILVGHDVHYHYIRSDENVPPDDTNCSLEESTVALACVQTNIDLTVLAKRELGKLWEDIKKPPYTEVFNENVTGTKLWRAIQVLRHVTAYMVEQAQSKKSGRERSFYIHSNRFILHLVFCKLPKDFLTNDKNNFSTDEPQLVKQLCEELTIKAFNYIEASYTESLMHQIFRNYKKCRDIKDTVLQN
jgi:hypothetical protein